MQILKSAIRKIYNIKVLTFIIINCTAHAQLPGSNAQPKSADLVESSSFFKPAPVFSASYQAGSFIKIRGNYLTLDLLLPVYQKNQVLFLVDAGFQRFDDAKYASNLGLGVRVCKEQKMAGAHLFYDSLSASCGTHFHRLGASFEWCEERFDLHANGYFPTFPSSGYCGKCVFDQIGGGYYAEKRTHLAAYPGFDVQIGKTLLKNRLGSLHASVGGYYFGRKCLDHFFGALGIIQASWNDLFFAKGRFSYDAKDAWQAEGSAGIRIPLNFSLKKMRQFCNRLFLKSIERNGIIMTDRYCNWSWNW